MKTPRSGAASPSTVEIRLEAVHLPAPRVALDLEVDEPEVVPVEDDHPGARPEDRAVELTERLVEAVEPHQPHERRRLAAGDHEPVEPVELLGLAHLDDVRAKAAQHRRVLAEVSLHGEDADLHGEIVVAAKRAPAAPRRRASHMPSNIRTSP